MSLHRSLAGLTLAVSIGLPSAYAAGPARGPAVAPAAAPAHTGHAGAPAARTENARHEGQERHRDRTVYVPGYGYTMWSGDYGNPYWNQPGTWYDNNGSSPVQQSSGTADNATSLPPPSSPAQVQAQAAQSEMTAARVRLAREFESSDAVRSALQDVQHEQRDYDMAVAKATRAVQHDPDYQQAEAKKEEAARKVDAAQAAAPQVVPSSATTQPAPISPRVVRAAEQKLNAATQVTAITSERVQNAPEVVEARGKVEAATDRLNGLKSKFDAALQADPQWNAAREKLASARTGAGTN